MLRTILPVSLLFGLTLSAIAKPSLEVWIMPNGANPQGILEERLADFRKETGLDAKVVVLDWGEAWSRISTALETGEGPDVVQLGTTWVSYFANKGWLAPLDAHLQEIDPSRFMATSWKTTTVEGSNSIYSIPWFVDVRVLMGNRRVLDGLGIKASDVATYDSYVAALRKIRQAAPRKEDGTPISPYSFPGKSDWNIPHNFAPWIWSEGGDFVVGQNGQYRSALLEEKTVVGIRKYIGFVLDTLMNSTTLRENTAQVAQRFNNGEQAFVLNTSEIIMQTRIPESEGGLLSSKIGTDGVRTFAVPAGPGGSVSFVGGSNLALPSAKAKSAQALKLLLFLSRPDNLDRYTRKIGFLPPDRGVLQEWSRDSLYAVLVQAAEKGRAYPNLPLWGEVETQLVEMFGRIWSLLDAGGAYSDEELYTILVEYEGKINTILGAPAQPPVAKAKFLGYLTPFLASSTTDSVATPVLTDESPLRKYRVPLVGLALFVLLVFGISFLKRSKD